MANKHPIWKFWYWFGANPFWDLIKFIGGTTVVSSLWTALKNEVHHHPVDWILFAVFMAAGIALTALSVHFQQKGGKAVEQDDLMPPNRVPVGDGTVEQGRLVLAGNTLDGAFTSLQIEAIILAKFLQGFIDSLDALLPSSEGKSFDAVYDNARTRSIKISTLYERDCVAQVNRFIQRAKIEMGYTSKRLEAYKDSVHDIENIQTVRAQLWLFVIRSSNVDFTGEM